MDLGRLNLGKNSEKIILGQIESKGLFQRTIPYSLFLASYSRLASLVSASMSGKIFTKLHCHYFFIFKGS